MANKKLYKAGQKPKGGAPPVQRGTQQGTTAKKQRSDHEGKNRSINHGRMR